MSVWTAGLQLHRLQLRLQRTAEVQQLGALPFCPVQGFHLLQERLGLFDLLQQAHMTCSQTCAGLRVLQGGLRPKERVPYCLAADPVVLGDLAQRQVLVIIQVCVFPLLLGEQLPVEVQQQREVNVLFQLVQLPL